MLEGIGLSGVPVSQLMEVEGDGVLVLAELDTDALQDAGSAGVGVKRQPAHR